MFYRYEDVKPRLFTEIGSIMFTAVRDNVNALLRRAGAVRFEEATKDIAGDTWVMIACFDRMVELGEIIEITPPEIIAQHRVFIKAYR